jgi:outer membrane receptor protein involved in Fe transport
MTYSLRSRLIGPSKLDQLWRSGIEVDDNSVAGAVTFDFSLGYKLQMFGADSELSLAVDNLLDTDPVQVPVVPGTVPYTYPGIGGRYDLYDAIGRRFRVGIRGKF